MSAVTRHIGRLGNNLFQIAAAIGYAKRYGYRWAADPSAGRGEPYSAIHRVFPNLPKEHPNGVRFHEHNNEFCKQHNIHKDLCHFDYHPIPDLGPNVTFTGFYQSWKYFENAQEEVKEVFKLDHYSECEGYVSIHIRRGDYVQHAGSFPPIDSTYITKAIQKIGSYNNFLVFSDEINWGKENIKPFSEFDTYEFFEDPDERKSLSAMASCSHHIIANSSFSWWAAYLGHNPNRTVISPSAETWFGPTSGVKRPVVDLLLPNWIQIHTR